MENTEPLIGEQQPQSKGFMKKYGAPLAVAGVSVAVALLLAGRTEKQEHKSHLLELPETSPTFLRYGGNHEYYRIASQPF